MNFPGHLISALLAIGSLPAMGAAGSQELARGATVTMAPLPASAKHGGAERVAAALTDGKISTQPKSFLWKDPSAAFWKYSGRVSLAVDLGKMSEIDEITIRLLGGSYEWGGQGKGFPIEVEAFVSDNGEDYRKVATFSRWNEGDAEKYAIPADRGEAWVHPLSFRGLGVKGRWVGLRIYTTGLSATDEISVKGRPLVNADPSPATEKALSDFTVHHPQFTFHKPTLHLATNAALPVPLGMMVPPDARHGSATFEITLPKGVTLKGATFGMQELKHAEATTLEDGRTRYQWIARREVSNPRWSNRKNFARLYLQADGWSDREEGELTYRFSHDSGWQSGERSLPIKAHKLLPAPPFRKLMAGLGWWYTHENQSWPDVLQQFKAVGLNTVSFTTVNSDPAVLTPDYPSAKWTIEARKEGFKIALIDSTIHRLIVRHAKDPEIFCQFADGTHGGTFCPSYRGPFWKEEVERYASLVRVLAPEFISQDIEIYTMADRVDFDFSDQPEDKRRCVRCKEDFEASGISNPKAWRIEKGVEMYGELARAARQAAAEAEGPPFQGSGYNFRPGQTYQDVWNYNRLSEIGALDHSQISSYNTMYPRHLGLIGDRIRKDRQEANGDKVIPWLTPGDAGPYSGETFQWMTLEAFVNGSVGIWFWSNRHWDSESLIAYNRVIHALGPVEEVIASGRLSDASVSGKGRVSAMTHEGQTVALVADYEDETKGSVTVQIKVDTASHVVDLLSGKSLNLSLAPGPNRFTVPLEGESARLLLIEPINRDSANRN